MTITAIRLNQPMLSKGTSNTSIPPCVKMQHRISSSLSLVLGRETSDLVSICQMTRDGRHLKGIWIRLVNRCRIGAIAINPSPSLSALCSLSRSSPHVWSLEINVKLKPSFFFWFFSCLLPFILSFCFLLRSAIRIKCPRDIRGKRGNQRGKAVT